jgi:hypothetical protein
MLLLPWLRANWLVISGGGTDGGDSANALVKRVAANNAASIRFLIEASTDFG